MWFPERLRLIRERYPYICMDAKCAHPATPRRICDLRRGIIFTMANGDTVLVYPKEDGKVIQTDHYLDRLEEEELMNAMEGDEDGQIRDGSIAD